MKRKAILYILSVIVITGARAQVVLPPVIDDGMVLQQNAKAALWGKAAPKSEVTVKTGWNDKTYKTKAGRDSLWKVLVETPAASFDAYTLSFANGGTTKTVKDVLIGEVWLCGGQSNMEMPMRGFTGQPIAGADEDIAASETDKIRVFTVARNNSIEPVFAAKGSWVKPSPATTPRISAVAYYFGRRLQEELNVPVGLLCCSYGGSQIETWIPSDFLSQAFPSKKIPQSVGELKKPTSDPTVLYYGMMNSLAGYMIKGALWYQGESNRKAYNEYPKLFETMHRAWESKWGIGAFPIYLCQIAPYDYAPRGEVSNLALMREAQASLPLVQKNTGIVVLLDIGEELIIHPAQKKPVGERLALLAMGKSYGKDVVCESPVYKGAKFDANKAAVFFDEAYPELETKGEIDGFELAGADKVFHPAKATATGSRSIEVVSDAVPNPVAVRYCFKSFVVGSLFGQGGFPVSSFRSDKWDEIF